MKSILVLFGCFILKSAIAGEISSLKIENKQYSYEYIKCLINKDEEKKARIEELKKLMKKENRDQEIKSIKTLEEVSGQCVNY